MALQLTKENPQGFSYDYHKIEDIQVKDDEFIVIVGSYKDAAARSAGKACVNRSVHRLDRDDVNLANPFFTQLYNLLKAGPFSGASDC